MTTRETKKARDSRLRQEERARLLEGYVEGVTNIDHDALKEKSWEEVYEMMDAGTLPMKPKEQWVEEELDKLEESRVKVPSYKVQDPAALLVEFQHKFVEEAKNVRPEVFEELRILAPHFKCLFARKADEEFSSPLHELKHSLVSHVLSSAYWQPKERITPDNVWEFLKHTFTWARTMAYIDAREPNMDFDEETRSQVEYYRYTLELFNRQITDQFQDTAEDPNHILINFYHLHSGVLDWVERHRLKYDWLVDYAYYFLFQFNRLPETLTKDIPVWPRRYHSSTLYKEFLFETSGWWASEKGENANEYKVRVRKEFEKTLDEYMVSAALFLSLEHKTKYTKPPSLETVKWLVRRVFYSWSYEQIVEHFFPKIAESRTASKTGAKSFEGKKRYVRNEMGKLKKYKLPVF